MVAERELTANQRNLVDTCFEEGNYEAAISALDKLRHPACQPYAGHVRNLVYIALYPAQQEGELLDARVDDNTSPSKMGRFNSKNHKASHTPTPAHSAAALRVLKAFARTNTPASLCRALPSFSVVTVPTHGMPAEEGGLDSEISKKSRCIAGARCVWDILREDFIAPESPLTQQPGSKRGETAQEDSEPDEDAVMRNPHPVGPSAWAILDWFLQVMEKDEQSTFSCDHVQYSPLLLDQIPPTRSSSAGRCHLELPLDVAFFCLQDPQRSGLGARLLTLLINLAHTTHIDLPIFLNLLSFRLSALSAEQIQTIFALLPETIPGTRFQSALCRTVLAGANSAKTGSSRPKAAPRRAGVGRTQSSNNLEASGEAEIVPSAPSILRTYPELAVAEVVRLLSSLDRTSSLAPAMRARKLQFKFQLLCAYGRLQALLPITDEAWQSALQAGEVARAIDSGFDCSDTDSTDVQVRAEDLKAILAVMGWYR